MTALRTNYINIQKMDRFKCFLCFSMFNDVEKAFNHLRTEHGVKQKVNEIKCIVNNADCTKTFQSWSGLKKHLQTCRRNFDDNAEQELNNNSNKETCMISNPSDEIEVQNFNISCYKIPIWYNVSPERNNDRNENEYSIIDAEEEPLLHSCMTQSVQRCADRIENLEVTQKVKNSIFILIEDLLSDIYMFNHDSIKNTTGSGGHILEVLEVAHDAVVNEVKKYDTTFKRNNIFEKNKLFVRPKEVAIGTHWETKRDRTVQKMYPLHTQSSFQYMSIMKTLKSLFLRKEFKQLYFDYNNVSTGSRHKCTEGVFKDFCCGDVYKKKQFVSRSSGKHSNSTIHRRFRNV